MCSPRQHRKLVKHHHHLGHCHELTFSCYRRLPLLTNDPWRIELSRAIDRACENHGWSLTAYVFMPEHVHLLVFPNDESARIDRFLFAVKRPFSYRIKQMLVQARSPLLKKLTVQQRPGQETFRYWQEGPGYDRNLMTEAAVLASLDYIHMNPVRRGLCQAIVDWRWSSARWYASDGQIVDPTLPPLTRLPNEFFTNSPNATPPW